MCSRVIVGINREKHGFPNTCLNFAIIFVSKTNNISIGKTLFATTNTFNLSKSAVDIKLLNF